MAVLVKFCPKGGTDRFYRIPRDDLDKLTCKKIEDAFKIENRKILDAGISVGSAIAEYRSKDKLIQVGIQVRSDFKTNKIDVDLWTRDFPPNAKKGKYKAYKDVYFHNINLKEISQGFSIKFSTELGSVDRFFSSKEIDFLMDKNKFEIKKSD